MWSEQTQTQTLLLLVELKAKSLSLFDQSFSLRPLQVVLPSREDPDGPLVDMDLHLPLLCFSHTVLLQVIRRDMEEDQNSQECFLRRSFCRPGALLSSPRTQDGLLLV